MRQPTMSAVTICRPSGISTNHCLQMLSTCDAPLPKMSSWPFDTDRLGGAATLKILLAGGRPLSASHA